MRLCKHDHVADVAWTLASLLVPQRNQRDIGVGPYKRVLNYPNIASLKHAIILDSFGPWRELVAIAEDDWRVAGNQAVELLDPVWTAIGDRLAPVVLDRDRQTHLGRYPELLAHFM